MAITTTAVAVSTPSLPGGMTSDPKLLPVYDATNTVYLYDNTTQREASVESFWTELGLQGAWVTGATDDTYKEICSLTGSGNLFHVIPPAHTNTSDTIGFRITVDGTVYEVLKTQTWHNSDSDSGRVVMGTAVSNSTTARYTTASRYLADYAGGGQTTSVFRKQDANIHLIPPSEILNNGMPNLRFEESLIVETKATDVRAGTYGPRCGASYILD